MLNGHNPDRARVALQHLDPNCPRDQWVKVGMSAHANGLSFDDFDTWSAGADSYNAQASRATWRSFKNAPGGVGAGALFGMARDAGWTEGNTQRPAPARPTPKPEPRPTPTPDPSIAEVWGRLQPATAQHPYAKRKQLCEDTVKLLRVVPDTDPLTAYRGWLAVPGYAIDGTLTMVEFVAPDGTKRSLKGSTKAGAMFTVGPAAGPAVVVEGLGAADAVYASTSARGVGTFGSGNTRAVVEALRQKEPAERITVAPDRGKEDDAKKIAAEFDCAVACVPECEPNNTDLNDIFCSPDGGFDVVAAILESASEPPKPKPLLKPVSVTDLFTHPSPPPDFAWESYCPLDEVTLFAANGGTGKSVIGLMLALAVATGRTLFDVPTKPGRVLFASLEDGADLVRHRLSGICRAWGIDPLQLRDRLTVIDGTDNPELFTVEGRAAGDVTSSYAELRKLAEGTTLVVIDNASDAYGGDEIKRREVRAFVRVLKRIGKAEHAAVVLLAHVNATTARARKPDNEESYSGSTAWNNSVRSRLFLSRDELGLLTLAHQKANLSKRREPITLQWLDDALPELVQAGPGFDGSRQQGRADDRAAAGLLRLMAEFEGREQYCATSLQARNNVFAVLKSEPEFQKLNMNSDSTKRVINQCQRAKWIEPLDYMNTERKPRQRWTLTADGREFAGLCAPTSESAHPHNGADPEMWGADCAHPHPGGVRGE